MLVLLEWTQNNRCVTLPTEASSKTGDYYYESSTSWAVVDSEKILSNTHSSSASNSSYHQCRNSSFIIIASIAIFY